MSSKEMRQLAASFSNIQTHKAKKGSRRTVRLELPPTADLLQTSQKPEKELLQSSEAYSGSFGSSHEQVQPKRMLPITQQHATLTLPTIFYEFSERTVPDFTFDVVTPDPSFPFNANPAPDLINPRFLIYSICPAYSATSIKLRINSTIMTMRLSSTLPIDATNLLAPFSQQNWIVIETGSFVIPFTICGVWASSLTMNDIITRLEKKEKFTISDFSAICPISGKPIEHPAKGVNCMHTECFDLVAYIGVALALGKWNCPICHQPLPPNYLILGSKPEFDVRIDDGDQLAIDGEGFWDF
jgi:hypothetical protein